jgi:C_GCAxxG_C_C family probable redox protein
MTATPSSFDEQAVELFRNGYNCSQAVLSTFGPVLGLDQDTCLKIACPFGGGIGRMGHVCGAVSGALMALGLAHGKGVDDGDDCKARSYELAGELSRRFAGMNGSIICAELLECDISTDEGYNEAKTRGLFDSNCEKYVRDASLIIADILTLG